MKKNETGAVTKHFCLKNIYQSHIEQLRGDIEELLLDISQYQSIIQYVP